VRRRWYTTKVGVLAAGLALAGLLVGLANDRLQVPLTRGGLTSSRWPWFFSIHIAPAAEAVLAFALAVAMGAWLRRTLPAIGAALVGFLALFLLSGWAVRSLTPLSRATGPGGTPHSSWDIGAGQYHPASQYCTTASHLRRAPGRARRRRARCRLARHSREKVV
jgi:hypothetical protein